MRAEPYTPSHSHACCWSQKTHSVAICVCSQELQGRFAKANIEYVILQGFLLPSFEAVCACETVTRGVRSQVSDDSIFASCFCYFIGAILKEIGQMWPQNPKIFLASQGRRSQGS